MYNARSNRYVPRSVKQNKILFFCHSSSFSRVSRLFQFKSVYVCVGQTRPMGARFRLSPHPYTLPCVISNLAVFRPVFWTLSFFRFDSFFRVSKFLTEVWDKRENAESNWARKVWAKFDKEKVLFEGSKGENILKPQWSSLMYNLTT